MPLDLAAPISAFFDATNRHDAGGVAECFIPNGLVHDERADHRSRAAIRKWADGTYRKYDVVLTPREVHEDGQVTAVVAGVAGTFPGSPIELQFRFVLAGDRISELMIA